MSWLIIFFAGLFEVCWAVGLKLNSNTEFRSPLILSLTILSVIFSLALLSLAMREIPLGTAYAIWTGIGAIGAFIIGIVFFNEPFTITRILSVSLLVAGLIGLKLSAPHGENQDNSQSQTMNRES